jgi:hypothetical protein
VKLPPFPLTTALTLGWGLHNSLICLDVEAVMSAVEAGHELVELGWTRAIGENLPVLEAAQHLFKFALLAAAHQMQARQAMKAPRRDPGLRPR